MIGVASFKLATGLIQPASGVAESANAGIARAGDTHRVAPAPAESRPWLVELSSPTHRVRVYSGENGVTYTLLDASGKVLGTDLQRSDLDKLCPELDFSSLSTDPEGSSGETIMYTDPDR